MSDKYPSVEPRRDADAASPWVRRAQRGALPYKVHADVHTDVRTVRESLSDVIRRTMPKGS